MYVFSLNLHYNLQLCNVGIILVPILQLGKLRHTEMRLAQSPLK